MEVFSNFLLSYSFSRSQFPTTSIIYVFYCDTLKKYNLDVIMALSTHEAQMQKNQEHRSVLTSSHISVSLPVSPICPKLHARYISLINRTQFWSYFIISSEHVYYSLSRDNSIKLHKATPAMIYLVSEKNFRVFWCIRFMFTEVISYNK